MTNINDLKFTIEPEETIEMEQFVNSDNKEKEKKIWIQVNWGFYRRREFTIHDFNVFDDCKTLEDIQKKMDIQKIGIREIRDIGKILYCDIIHHFPSDEFIFKMVLIYFLMVFSA